MEMINKKSVPPGKINLLKTICFISGIILLIAYYAGNEAIEKAMNKEINGLNLSYNPILQSFDQKMKDPNYFKVSSIQSEYQMYSTILSLTGKVFALILCGYLGKYVKGHWIIWAILGLFFPYFTLIIISFIPVKKEFLII